MPIIAKIKKHYSLFSSAEKKVASYIMNQPDSVLQMTVQQLASKSQTSAATVIRLGKKIDVDGFTPLKIELAADLTQTTNTFHPDITKGEQVNSIKDKLLYNAQTSLNETVLQLDDQQLQMISRKLSKVRNLIVFGIGASYLTALNIAQKWGRIGIAVTPFNDLDGLLPLLVNANQNDLIWIISNSGESSDAIQVGKIANQVGVPILSLTQSGNNSVSKLSTIAVHTSQPIEFPDRIAATNSLLVQFTVVDIIFYEYVSHNYDQSIERLGKSAEIIKTTQKKSLK